MDELIAIAKRLDDAFIRFASETENQATSRRNQAVKDAATALRASQAEIARLAEAERYAEGLAVALAARHYPEVDVWRPLSGDLIGLLTQIDNMTSGLSRTARAERAEAALREIEMLRYGDETFLTDANRAHNIARAALPQQRGRDTLKHG